MFVFAKDAAQTVTSTDVEACDRVWIGDRIRQRILRPGVRDSPMGSVGVVVPLVLVQGAQQVRLVPEKSPVQQLVTAAVVPGRSPRW